MKIMPAKNVVKIYIEDGVYHIYNRGVEKRNIFLDEKDYIAFLGLLKKYLSPTLEIKDYKSKQVVQIQNKNSMDKEISLLCFCLMPNHYHLLVKQKNSPKAIEHLLRKVCTSYSIYFNKKYKRVGKLFQGNYKAVLVTDDFYLMQLSRYIHKNPLEISKNDFSLLEQYRWSSYPFYLKLKKAKWINTQEILNFFNENKYTFGYKYFVEKYELKEYEEIPDNQKIDEDS